MKILLCSKNQLVIEKISKACADRNIEIFYCKNFAEVVLFQEERAELFICDINSCLRFADAYKVLREDRKFYIPYTIFIANKEIDTSLERLTNRFILSSKFNLDNYLTNGRFMKFNDNEQKHIKDSFAYFGLSYRDIGTHYIEEVLRLVYFKPLTYFSHFNNVYEVLGKTYNKTANAIKKAIKRSIDNACLKHGKGILELKKVYPNKKPTNKLVITSILAQFNIVANRGLVYMENYC